MCVFHSTNASTEGVGWRRKSTSHFMMQVVKYCNNFSSFWGVGGWEEGAYHHSLVTDWSKKEETHLCHCGQYGTHELKVYVEKLGDQLWDFALCYKKKKKRQGHYDVMFVNVFTYFLNRTNHVCQCVYSFPKPYKFYILNRYKVSESIQIYFNEPQGHSNLLLKCVSLCKVWKVPSQMYMKKTLRFLAKKKQVNWIQRGKIHKICK